MIVQSRCGPHATAGHYFATYAEDSKILHLDYSLLHCPDQLNPNARSSNLHQIFVYRNGRYVLDSAVNLGPGRAQTNSSGP